MKRGFRLSVNAALLGAACLCLAASTSSAIPGQAGVLECNIAPGIGFVIGSAKAVSCVFHRHHGRPEFYTGTISRIGVDIGVTGPVQFAWSVITEGPPPRYALAGEYTGAGGSLAIGPGVSTHQLVGGYGNMVNLQPISAGETTGLNLSAGIGALSLQPSQPMLPPRHG
ncbi:MAG TPA: DUF992 domain-containing protein [Methylocella sp.]|nr:DUF992 domain-containing protein [Methylocella sp.]